MLPGLIEHHCCWANPDVPINDMNMREICLPTNAGLSRDCSLTDWARKCHNGPSPMPNAHSTPKDAQASKKNTDEYTVTL